MSIRVVAAYVMVIGLSIHAWKDWFKSLCGLIVLMAVLEHPDMPRSLLGIPGMNLWNLLFGVIILAWAASRRREGLIWDTPRHVTILLWLYIAVIVVGVARAALDLGHYTHYPLSSLIMEELITTLKWILPALLLFDGCRNRRQVIMALLCLLAMYLLVALQIYRHIPLASALGDGGDAIHAKRLKIGKEIGYHTTNLSVMLAGAFWGMVAALPLLEKKAEKVLLLAGAGIVVFGMALTGGRGGYVAWGFVGLTLCLIKWRRYLLLAPFVVMLLPIALPGATARMLEGFGQTDAAGQATIDEEAATSGRTLIWPYVIEKIGESPWIGHGRLAMKRTGLYDRIETEFPGTGAPHPHNMYLETLFDNGLVGSLLIICFWVVAVAHSAKLFRSKNRLYAAVGGLTLAGSLASLSAGISGQHFYPKEQTMTLWATVFLSLRVYVEEKRLQAAGAGASAIEDDSLSWREDKAFL